MILRLIKIRGHSLEPQYSDGDFVLVSKIPIWLRGIRPGDAVLFRHPSLGLLVKLVDRMEDDGSRLFVVGLNPDSRDSRTFGAIPRSLVAGKIIAHFRKKTH